MKGINMFKKYWFIFLALALTITAIITGCETLQTTGTSGGREYFPNTDGYSWTYRATFSGTTETQTLKISFSGTATAGSLTVQKWKSEIFSGTAVYTSESYLRVTDADVKYYGDPTYPSTIETGTFLAFPLKVGSKWFTYGTSEANVVALENITVLLGAYNNCFKVKASSGSINTYMWFAQNIGCIKVQQTMGTFEVNMDLTSKNF